MHHTDSILSILHGPFLMESSAMQSFLMQVAQVVTGKVKAEDLVDKAQAGRRSPHYAHTPHAAALGTMGYDSLDEVPAGSIAVHMVSGPMMPDDSWFGRGTKSIGQGIVGADMHPNIIGHVGVFNTPGGSTMGLEDFAGIIGNTQKPFVGYAQYACSAGCWSISGADSIVLAGRTAMMGSIGTKAEFLDFTGFFESMGIKQVSAKATKSTNKNRSFDEAVAGNIKPLQQEILDPLNEVFLSTMLENRGDKIPVKQQTNVLSGLVYVGQANLDNGLADLMGTLDDAIALAEQLAGAASPASSSTTSSKMGIFNKNKLGPAMTALAGAETVTAEMATAATDELKASGITGVSLLTAEAQQQLETKAGERDAAVQASTAAEGKLTAMTGERDAAVQASTAVTEALTAADATDVAALATDRDGWKTKAETYGSQAGVLGTSAKKEGAEIQEGTPASAAQKAIDGLAHNAALDNHPLFGGK